MRTCIYTQGYFCEFVERNPGFLKIAQIVRKFAQEILPAKMFLIMSALHPA